MFSRHHASKSFDSSAPLWYKTLLPFTMYLLCILSSFPVSLLADSAFLFAQGKDIRVGLRASDARTA